MRRDELVELAGGITMAQALKGDFSDDFTYALSLTRRKMKDEMECIEEKRKEYLEEYNDKIDDLKRKHCEKDKDKNPIMVDNGYKIKAIFSFQDDIKKLDKKYKKEIDAFGEFMKGDAGEVKIYKLEKLPEIPTRIADALFLLRKERDE